MTELTSGKSRGFTRRSFIAGAAALTAAGALSGCSAKTETLVEGAPDPSKAGQEEIYYGACRGNCFGGCMLKLHVRDGQLVRTSAGESPDPKYNRICTRGLTHPERIYSADRVKYPMRRIGERGEGNFERISWDEAIEEITSKWKGYAAEFGPSSIAYFVASGNSGVCSGAMGGITARVAPVFGFSTISSDVDAAAGFAASKGLGGMTDYQANNEPADYVNSKTIIIWGANPAVSQPHVMHFMMEAQEKGTKIIDIDPVYNSTVSKADKHIPINPATDGALALSILNEIIVNHWEDEEFLRVHTEAPLLIKDDGKLLRLSDLGVAPTEGAPDPQTGKPTVVDPFVVWDEAINSAVAIEEAQKPAYTDVAEVEGIAVQTVWANVAEQAAKWPAEVASQVCGVSVEDIKELARVYHEDGPVNTYSQLGPDHYINGHYNYWPMAAVSIATGNIAKSGAGFGQTCVLPFSATNFVPSTAPTDSHGNAAQGAGPAYCKRGVGDILSTGKYGEQDAVLKSIYVQNGNPMTIWTNREYSKSIFESIEFVVVAEISMTETAKWADILLPAAHWFEQVDLFTTGTTSPYYVWQDKAVEPQFEAKSDFEIIKLLADAMGYGDFFNFTEEEWISMVLDTPAGENLGLTVDNLREKKAMRFLSSDPYISFDGGKFLTPSGRARFYLEDQAPAYNIGQEIDLSKETVLYWEPTLAADKNSQAREKYPFHCLSEHARTRTHSQWWEVGVLKEFEAEPVVSINPEDAAELNVDEGDMVRLFNEFGTVTMKATLAPGYPRGIVGSPRSFHASEFVDGHFASLSTKEYNQVCANQVFNDVAVAIEKA